MQEVPFITIYLGVLTAVLTFGIPIIWGTIRNITNFYMKLDGLTDDKIKKFKTLYFNKKLSRKIKYFILTPLLLIGFSSILFIVSFYLAPKSPLLVYLIGFVIIFLLLVFAPSTIFIFEDICNDAKRETKKEINSFETIIKFINKDAIDIQERNNNILDFLESIFQKKDKTLKAKYGIYVPELIKSILMKMNKDLSDNDKIIKNNDTRKINLYNKIIDGFSLSKRNIYKLVQNKDIVKKILNLHFKIWQNKKNLSVKKAICANYEQYFSSVNNLISQLISFAISDNIIMNNFWSAIKNHALEKELDNKYLYDFPFENIIFNNIKPLMDKDKLGVIPNELKLSINNLEKHEELTNIISDKYKDWFKNTYSQRNSINNKITQVSIIHNTWINEEIISGDWLFLIYYKLIDPPTNALKHVIPKKENPKERKTTLRLLKKIDITFNKEDIKEISELQREPLTKNKKEYIKNLVKDLKEYYDIN